MTLDYYRIFYYVAQYQSFSKAAEILGNNQPNLSRCMNLPPSAAWRTSWALRSLSVRSRGSA